MLDYLKMAGEVALKGNDIRIKNFLLGAVGIRNDGVRVYSRNGAVSSSATTDYTPIISAHAEVRNLSKLGKYGELYVARVLKLDHSLAMASPCLGCRLKIRSAKVSRVFYTVNDYQYGIWTPSTDKDIVIDCSAK